MLKVADFGLARVVSAAANLTATVCGSPLYMAPEVQNWWPSYQKTGQVAYTRADLWSIGCILHYVLRQLAA